MNYQYEQGYLPPKVVEMAKEIEGGMRNRIAQFEKATSYKTRKYWAEKVMEIATPDMWLTYYQNIKLAKGGSKGGQAKVKKGFAVSGKTKLGGRKKTYATDAEKSKAYRERKKQNKAD